MECWNLNSGLLSIFLFLLLCAESTSPMSRFRVCSWFCIYYIVEYMNTRLGNLAAHTERDNLDLYDMEQQRNKVSYALPIFILMKLLRFVISPHNLDFIAFLILISSIGILMEAICWIFMQICSLGYGHNLSYKHDPIMLCMFCY
jgi:hypothetical protein